MERVNISIQKQIKKGHKIIEESGGVEAYDKIARSQKGAKKPELKIESKSQIVFED